MRAGSLTIAANHALLLLALADGTHGYQAPLLSSYSRTLPLARSTVRLDLSRALFGDSRKAPIRSAIKEQFTKKTIGLCPPDLIDYVLNESFSLLEKMSASSGGLEKLLLRPGELQKQRNSLRRDLSKRLAANVDTPLGNELEEKLGGFAIDAVLDQALSNNEFLLSPSDRLASLERKLTDVKLEMGLVSLALYRIKHTLRIPAVKLLTISLVVTAAAAGGLLFYAPAAPHVRSIAALAGAKAIACVNALARWLAVMTGGLA